MKKFGFEELPTGKIVGRAKLIEVKKYESTEEFNKDKNKHLADASWGEYGFILEGAKRTKPLPAKGMLGFWEYGKT